jgi:hypothetical protein
MQFSLYFLENRFRNLEVTNCDLKLPIATKSLFIACISTDEHKNLAN